MLVGKIQNQHGAGQFVRGQEKGMLLYGGSTAVLLLERGRVSISESIFQNHWYSEQQGLSELRG